MKKTFAALALLALASACASSGSSGPRTDWSCAEGRAFSLRYNAQGAAEVFAAGRTYTLPQVQSGSGARYSDGAVEYWEHSGEATLNGAFGGPYANCRRG
ncbi:MAG: MliC family protein [Hyphomonadaceae bacterium]|nr:MliC family protein [Hyphomonadaceae bacterium]